MYLLNCLLLYTCRVLGISDTSTDSEFGPCSGEPVRKKVALGRWGPSTCTDGGAFGWKTLSEAINALDWNCHESIFEYKK